MRSMTTFEKMVERIEENKVEYFKNLHKENELKRKHREDNLDDK